jgi:hypothetical protein
VLGDLHWSFAMPFSSDSNQPSSSTLHLVDMALQMLKQNVEKHIEQGMRLERLYVGWRHSWQTQYDQLRNRIETLETRVSPWVAERVQGPQLALISHQEDAA